jgi:hypothetical protein
VNLFSARTPADPGKYLCGTATGLTSTSGKVTGLLNGVTYSIGVAAVDSVGNTGPLSLIVCNAPQPIDDFYKLYREAGGRAGGGYCQASGPLGVGAMWGPWVGLGAAAVARVARRALRRRSLASGKKQGGAR